MTVDPSHGNSDVAPADWLLRQRRILIHDGTITWRDEQRGAPPLELTRVEFRMENRFGRHRFGLTGAPPAAIAAPIDLRGDITGHSLAEWRTSSGRLYARLDYADVAAWQAWLPLPVCHQERQGGGARLAGIRRRGGARRCRRPGPGRRAGNARAGVAAVALARLDGRLGWRSDGNEREVFTEHLAFSGAGATRFDPTDFKLVLRKATAARAAVRADQFSNLQLGPLMQVAASLPLAGALAATSSRATTRAARSSQGRLQWQGEATAPDSFVASTRFTDFGIDAQDRLPGSPGCRAASMRPDHDGALMLQSRSMQVDLPGVFTEPLALDSVRGRVGWERKGGASR